MGEGLQNWILVEHVRNTVVLLEVPPLRGQGFECVYLRRSLIRDFLQRDVQTVSFDVSYSSVLQFFNRSISGLDE